MDERVRFIAAIQEDPRGNFSRLCERFGISRDKGYKWLARYKAHGPKGLEDKPPVARSCPHRTADEVVDLVVAERKAHPFDGPKKLRGRLINRGELDVPAASTIGEILNSRGLIRPRRRRLRVPPSPNQLDPCAEPNDVWCLDFKGHFTLGDKMRCDPLTLTDAASRYLLKCEAVSPATEGPVRAELERAFHEFGLPHKIRSDNGPPFASKALGGLSRLSVWWIQLGVLPERIEPGKPQQNGRHERMHKTLKQHTASPPQATMVEQQRAFDRFRRDYNEERPHEALGQTPPAAHYEPSPRVMPDKPRPPEYGDDFTVRRVNTTGQFTWKGQRLLAGAPLANEPIGVRQTDEDEWEIFYGPLLVGYVLLRDGQARIEPLR
jgi:transposase InsO family protein